MIIVVALLWDYHNFITDFENSVLRPVKQAKILKMQLLKVNKIRLKEG